MRRWLLLWLLTPVLALAGPARPGAIACATAHPLATEACLELLRAGGNAVDAAVAASAAIAVVEPTGSGIGGGGFWLLRRAEDGQERFVDGRETAPLAAHARMYLDAEGRAVAKASRDGALAAAIPGEPAALDHLARRYGRLGLARALQPAIRYAREGFACDDKLAEAFARHWPRLNPAARAVFAVEGRAPRTGERLVQTDLARTLERLAAEGAAGFYQGPTAEALLRAVSAGGGVWSAEDLRRYRVVEREPLVFHFREHRIVSAPPPSAGGITLAQTLGQLELMGVTGFGAVESRHRVIEALRRAYRDRARWLGDPDFVRIPQAALTGRDYLRELSASIRADAATRSESLPPAAPWREGSDTTHLSVLDAEGGRVAATLSINLPFGSGFLAEGTGVLLNDEMDDFAASTEASNAYGLIGSQANLIAAGKRPLSSMTPTFVEGPRGLLVIGTPGGSRIITMVLLGLLHWIEGASVAEVVALPRYHHQYLPDGVQYEPAAFDDATRERLTALGHRLQAVPDGYGNLQALHWDPQRGVVEAASDPRGVGAARVERLAPR
ncbi:MAG TPA: gamma-glutamyltransferase [Nevskiaceae bacterium]|nr:gamma-glutamyltransferase [Nevskiaceae bacterium]